MSLIQSEVAGVVVAFRSKEAPEPGFSRRDCAQMRLWQSIIGRVGYDRVLIHERNSDDAPDIAGFLGVYPAGEPWARWGMARTADGITVWCCVSGADIGIFPSITDAFQALFPALADGSTPEHDDNWGRLIALG